MAKPLALPGRSRTAAGALRRVGVELELGGLSFEELSALVVGFTGGQVRQVGRYEHLIAGDPAGDWLVEFDYEYLKRRGREPRDDSNPLQIWDELTEDLLRLGAELIVPLEVVSPPLPMDRLADVDRLIARLRRAGACGTREGIAWAFGLHLNPEMPDTDAGTVLAYLRAFLCLYPWLKQQCELDVLRRLTNYIDPFPDAYVERVLDPGYSPDVATLIEDYVRANPTRNRALDMLPLFAHIDASRVTQRLPDRRIKARPTLHYRLPNSEVDVQGWGVRAAWNDWLQVESLAADAARLAQVGAEYRRFLQRPMGWLLEDWPQRVSQWLENPEHPGR